MSQQQPSSPPSDDHLASNSDGQRARHTPVLVVLVVAVGCAAAALVDLLGGRHEIPPTVPVDRRDLVMVVGLALATSLAALWDRVRFWRSGAPSSGAAAPLRWLLYCLVGAWLGYLLVIGSYQRGVLPSWVAIALAVFAGGLLVAPVLRSSGASRILRAADIVLLNLCILVIAAELGLRVLAAVRPSVLFMRAGSQVLEKVERGRYPLGTVRYGFPVNSTGHYDEPFVPRGEGQLLVVAIGDSFSAGVVHHHFHFTTVAERALGGLTVYNMGLPSIDPPEYHYLLVTEALALDPDVVVVNIFTGNDLTHPVNPEDSNRMLRSLLDRRNVLILLVPQRLLKVAHERGATPESFGESSGDEILEEIADVRRQYPWFDDRLAEQPTFAEETFLQIEGFRFGEVWTQPKEAIEARLQPLLEMRRAAGDVPLLVMIIPDEFEVEDGLFQQINPGHATEDDRARGRRILKGWLEREGFEFLDLLPMLRDVPPLVDGNRHLYHQRDTHFNVRGNQVVGEALADFLRPYLCVN